MDRNEDFIVPFYCYLVALLGVGIHIPFEWFFFSQIDGTDIAFMINTKITIFVSMVLHLFYQTHAIAIHFYSRIPKVSQKLGIQYDNISLLKLLDCSS